MKTGSEVAERETSEERTQRFSEQLIEHVPHSRDMGHRIEEVRAGVAVLRQPFRDCLVGDPEHGLIHTGVQITLIDAACGIAVFSALGKIQTIATLDLRMDYLRPAVAGVDLLGCAECYRLTGQIAFVRGTVWQDDRERPVSTAQAAFMLGTARKRTKGIEEVGRA